MMLLSQYSIKLITITSKKYHILHVVLILPILCLSSCHPLNQQVFYSLTWQWIIMLILARKKWCFHFWKHQDIALTTFFTCHCYRNRFISNLVITKLQTHQYLPPYFTVVLRSLGKASINTWLESPSITGEQNKTKQ